MLVGFNPLLVTINSKYQLTARPQKINTSLCYRIISSKLKLQKRTPHGDSTNDTKTHSIFQRHISFKISLHVLLQALLNHIVMPAEPTKLDIIDSKISPEVRAAYNSKVAQFQRNSKSYWQFSIVPNKFVQSLDETDDTKFNYLDQHFGKIGEWDDLIEELHQLNKQADKDTQYKILFLARHYTGYHNIAHAKYGDDAWNDHWSKLNGDDEYTWGPDAELIQELIELAKKNSKLVAKELENNRHQNKSLIMPQKCTYHH